MEQFFANPGFAHIADEIISHLDHKTLLAFGQVCTSFKKFVDNPKIWLRRCKRVLMSDKDEAKWRKLIEFLNNTDGASFDKILNQVRLYLTNMSKSFYNVQSPIHCSARMGDLDLLKLALEIKKVETSDQYWQDGDLSHNETPMHVAAQYGHLEVFKYLEKYMKFPKRHLTDANPPILSAIIRGHTEIVKHCAQEDPIKPEEVSQELFNFTADIGQLEVLKVLFSTLGFPHIQELIRMRDNIINFLSYFDAELFHHSAALVNTCNYITEVIVQQIRKN